MISFSGSLKVYVALDPIDMRKGFEGLYAAVSEKLHADVKSGAISCNQQPYFRQSQPKRQCYVGPII